MPGLETNKPSSDTAEAEPRPTTYGVPSDEEVENLLDATDSRAEGSLPPLVEDEEDPMHTSNTQDPPGNLCQREYQYPNPTLYSLN